MPKFKLLALTLLVLTVLACGGGGGAGTPTTGKLVYKTFWAPTKAAVPGSQRITMRDSGNNLLQTLVVETTDSSVSFDQRPAGTYRILVELFSQASLGGTLVGTIEAELDVVGNLTFESAVGTAVNSVAVTPAQAVLTVPQSRKFFAYGVDSNNRATFTQVGSFTWSALGGVAEVNQSGLAQAVQQGTGSVRATHTTGKFSGAAITVNAGNPTTGKWTVLVFMNAANDLYPFSTLNLNQMEQVAGNPDVRFVVQWKQSKTLFSGSSFDGTRRYVAKPDTTSAIASELVQDLGLGVDMGDIATLQDFVEWGKRFYPAERTVLVLWNHGDGWRRSREELPSRAVSYDDETGNAIQIWELATGLAGETFDIVAFDASLMQMLEVAYDLRGITGLVAGSEESPPGEGYPYHRIFDAFRDNPTATSRNLSKQFVEGMLEVPEYQSRKITQSVVDTTKLDALAIALDGLAGSLIANQASVAAEVVSARASSQPYSPTLTRHYRDLIDLCDHLEALTSGTAVATAAANARSKALAAIVWEGHNNNSPGSRGLSIDFSPSDAFASQATDYSNLGLAKDTRWDEWLFIAP